MDKKIKRNKVSKEYITFRDTGVKKWLKKYKTI